MNIPVARDDNSCGNPDRLLSVEMRDWQPLGGPLRVNVAPRKTVLVGKNGAGKSMVLDGIYRSALAAVRSARISPLGPGTIQFNFIVSGKSITYSYSWEPNTNSTETDSLIQWQERCFHTESGNEIWRVQDETAILAQGAQFPLPAETGLLSLKDNPAFPMPDELPGVRRMLKGIQLITAGIPRTERLRFDIRLQRGGQKKKSPRRRRDDRLLEMAALLVRWYEENRGLYDQFEQVGNRVGAFTDIKVEIAQRHKTRREEDIAHVSFDGSDFGYLSDGTLRIAEILLDLVNPAETVLVIEEPETAIHPGLLNRILAEIDAHTVTGKQVIISTHSPQVVDWALPSELRLVLRINQSTAVRELTEEEAGFVSAYLNDDGTLGDYIFGQSDI